MKRFSSGFRAILWGATLVAGFAIAPAWAQNQYPPSSPYPPQQQQYPQQQQPQYPQQQPQYPPPAGQYPQQAAYAPPMLPPQQVDQLVGPIALYPDGLLAQLLTGSTFYTEIPDAAGWANQHGYLNGPALANAIQQDRLPWDPSILALLPFPRVLNYMASNMGWTQQLGNAVLAQRGEVMDAVQRMRQRAYDYGYLRSGQYERVIAAGPNYIEILPTAPDYYYVPYYDPYIVYARPRAGFFIGGALRFGPGISIGAFVPFGWGGVGFGWREHTILVDRRPWVRSWDNRGVYVHPYAAPHEHWEGPREEHHELRGSERHEEHDHHEGEHDRR